MATPRKDDTGGHRGRSHKRNKKCQTCGGTVPDTRTDRRYCTWRHDPELVTLEEWEEVKAQVSRPEVVTNAS